MCYPHRYLSYSQAKYVKVPKLFLLVSLHTLNIDKVWALNKCQEAVISNKSFWFSDIKEKVLKAGTDFLCSCLAGKSSLPGDVEGTVHSIH